MPTSSKATEAISQIEADPSKILGLEIGSHDIQLDQKITVADAQPTPTIIPNTTTDTPLSSTKTYLLISLDLSAPYPSLTFLSPILHWIQPGLKLESEPQPDSESESKSNLPILKPTSPFLANYIPPSPPPMSGCHQYVFLLYEQPEGFDGGEHAPLVEGREMGIWGRVRFDFDRWAREVGLGGVVGGNWFWCC